MTKKTKTTFLIGWPENRQTNTRGLPMGLVRQNILYGESNGGWEAS